MCLVIRKYERKEDGKIYVSEATRTVNILDEQTMECELYPIAHFLWESEKGYARGVSEVKQIIPNQKEINKTATRRAISVKMGAYPKIVYDKKRVNNISSLTQIGSTIGVDDLRSDDINKVVSYLAPASMSGDAYNLQQDLINATRELAGANETATGQIDPEKASGKAILAVQQASQQPLNEQTDNYRYFLEDCGRIVFDLIKTYFVDGLTLYNSEQNINSFGETEEINMPYKISSEELESLDLNLKIDITPTSSYDRYAQEVALENMLIKGLINLEEYTKALPDNSTSPKTELDLIIRDRKIARNMISRMQQEVNAIDSAIKQTMIENGVIDYQGGNDSEMSQMSNNGNASEASERGENQI